VRAAEAQVQKLTETVEQLRKALKEKEAQAKEWNERWAPNRLYNNRIGMNPCAS
jgi:hypothetical protein